MSTRSIGLGSQVRFTLESLPTVIKVIKEGSVVTISTEVLPVIGTSLYSVSLTPVETGFYDIVTDGSIAGSVEVYTRDIFSFLRNLEDQAFGGWEWDKTTKVMTIYRQDGSTLATYLSEDTLETAYSTPTISS